MNYRVAKLLATTTYAADKVEIIDIDLADPISMLQIFYSAMNQAPDEPATANLHPAGCISKIDLVDGSDLLFSLSGFEAQALDFYHNKKMPYHNIKYLNDNYSHSVYQLNFGRFLYDTLLAFDPKKFINPQLKISIDLDGGGCNCDAGRMEVLAHTFDEKVVTPTGFLMAKELVSYTLANNAHEYIDLPTDHLYRKLLVSPRRPGTQPDVQLEHIKLSQDGDKKVIFDEDIRELVAILQSNTPPCREMITGAGTTTLRYFGCMPSIGINAVGSGFTNAKTEGITFWAGDGGRLQEIQTTAGHNWKCLVSGWCPHCAIEIPFGLQDEIEDWFDVTKIGSLKLDITAGATPLGLTCQVFLQQLRNY
ncbi:hypothetical protein ES702_05022 [subsurface metagenome]